MYIKVCITSSLKLTILGKHNFQGVITLDNGTAIPIGGGERIFKLTTSPAKGSWQFHTELDEQRRIVMQGFSESFGIDLNPSPYTLWEMDMGGNAFIYQK